MSQQVTLSVAADSPFNLGNNAAYLQWREKKSRFEKLTMDDLLVQINNPQQLTVNEKSAIIERCKKYNMAIYQLSDTRNQDKSLVHALGQQFAMDRLDANLRSDEDGVSSLEVRAQVGNQYIPYTNKALNWHTDGYYNALDKQIFGIIMHCVRPAAEGGVNLLLNPDNVYIALRDKNPAYIEALMHPQAMTIPDNVEGGKIIRAAQAGPVFIIKPAADNDVSHLHMRFSARKRNIIWRDNKDTIRAVEKITQLLEDKNNVLQIALQAGQGIICNNVLHNRSGFTETETQKRLMYRARYYDAVASNEK